MRKKLVVGNWKLNGSLQSNFVLMTELLSKFSKLKSGKLVAAVCPPYPYLAQVGHFTAESDICLGAQDVAEFASGAYTGSVSATMLKDLRCDYVIVGHSERRCHYGESSLLVAKKAEIAYNSGLIPIVCVGETADERAEARTLAVIQEQLEALWEQLPITHWDNVVIAYEPVWAIGTGVSATPEVVMTVHQYIRETIAEYDQEIADNILIIYGGSVKPENAAELFSKSDIDGALVGGASLDVDSFNAICQLAIQG